MTKKRIVYFETVQFKTEPSYDEREGMVLRRIYQEQERFHGKDLKWIVVEKDNKHVKIKFSRKQLKNESKV